MAPNDKQNDSTTTTIPEKGDQVSWQWAGGRPTGEVVDVKEGETQIKSKNGNTIARHGSEADPVVKIVSDSTGNMVLKKAKEVDVEAKNTSTTKSDNKSHGEKRKESETPTKADDSSPKKQKTGDKDEEKLKGKKLDKDDEEVIAKHADKLTDKDWKEPIGRRTRSHDPGKNTESQAKKLEKELFAATT